MELIILLSIVHFELLKRQRVTHRTLPLQGAEQSSEVVLPPN